MSIRLPLGDDLNSAMRRIRIGDGVGHPTGSA